MSNIAFPNTIGAEVSTNSSNPNPIIEKFQNLNYVTPFVINGNTQLASYATSGSGIATDPYILEYFYVNCTYSGPTHALGTGLFIENTNAYFWVYNSRFDSCGDGIQLSNVTNGNINLNGFWEDKSYGILVYKSFNDTVMQNTITNNVITYITAGILIRYSSYISVKYNSPTGTGIGVYLDTSNFNTINNNNPVNSSGIELVNSYNNTIKNNLMSSGSAYSDGISLSGSYNSTVYNNNIKKNYEGINVYNSSFSSIFDNLAPASLELTKARSAVS